MTPLPEKPEWLTMEDIDRYAQRMEPPYEVVVYHHFENGFDEQLDYQTLAKAEQAAQKYVAGTMEGEDSFAYDGAGIYDLYERKWLRVYGDFPDERAIEQAAQAMAAEEQQEKDGPARTEADEPAPSEELVGKEVTLDGHRFMVERVSDLSDDVTLRDLTFEGNVGFPIRLHRHSHWNGRCTRRGSALRNQPVPCALCGCDRKNTRPAGNRCCVFHPGEDC